MNAILVAQACLRAMLPPRERKAALHMRSTAADPQPLRRAQEVGNRILVSPEAHTPIDVDNIIALSRAAEDLLFASGFVAFAQTLQELCGGFLQAAGRSPKLIEREPQQTKRQVTHATTDL